jgi:predicted nucleic acid-binding protein
MITAVDTNIILDGMIPGEPFGVLADFLIGAHALVQADCILSRDLGVYKTYFSNLTVIDSIR